MNKEIVNENKVTASLAGEVSLGGEVSVHRLGFGAMRLTGEGIWGPPKDRKAAIAVLRRAVELDVKFIDTADSYGPHTSEELIAEALFPYPAGLVIATKGGWNRPGPGQWTHDATPSHLRNAVEGSLKRLRVERIEVYQLHIPDPVVSFEASMETLAQLRQEGKIRLVALSNVTQEHIERARKIVPIVSVQNRYSFADREWDYVVNHCERNRIAFIPWFPLGAGRIAGEVLNRIAQAHHAKALRPHANHERWLVSYADFITLLFAFLCGPLCLLASGQEEGGAGRRFDQGGAFQQLGVFTGSRPEVVILGSPGIPLPELTATPLKVVGESRGDSEQAHGVAGFGVDVDELRRQLEKRTRRRNTPARVKMRVTPEGLVVFSLREVGFFNSGEAIGVAGESRWGN